jgi:hypothetical protein
MKIINEMKEMIQDLNDYNNNTILIVNKEDKKSYFVQHDDRHPSVYVHAVYFDCDGKIQMKKFKTKFTFETFEEFYRCIIQTNFIIYSFKKNEWANIHSNISSLSQYVFELLDEPISFEDLVCKQKKIKFILPKHADYSILTLDSKPNSGYRVIYKPKRRTGEELGDKLTSKLYKIDFIYTGML